MKTLFPLLMGVALLTALGCKEGTPGGPGVAKTPGTSSSTSSSTTSSSTTTSPDTSTPTTTTTTTPDATKIENPLASDPEDSFRLDAPNLGVTVKQGEAQEVTIGISKTKNFQEDVTLEFGELPKGVAIDPAAPMIKASDKDVKVTVKAEPDAALNDFTIQITGHPTKGADAKSELKVMVAKP